MKKLIHLAVALLATVSISLALAGCSEQERQWRNAPHAKVAEGMVQRLFPQFANQFELRIIPGETDYYEIYSEGGKIRIAGNNDNSVAVGINHYLKEYCLTDVSWYAADPVEMPETLPTVPQKVRAEARVDTRFFLNYCTYGYTMPWFDWTDWERLIDWMALNGVTMPLAITGQEAVWLEVWKKYGMSEEEILSYFTGPSHLPWHRMNNIDRWQGPLPMSWIEGQKELQKKILERERAFNMRPVLPAFAGHIPAEIAAKFPEANTALLSRWGEFDDQYRCSFLSPTDPLYQQIQKDFLEEQTKLYGTDHLYGMDLFNEVEAPSWEPTVLNGMAKDAYGSLTAVDPDATWLQMAWLFYHDQKHWTPEILEAYLTGVPQGKVILLDYYCECQEIWPMTNQFYGQPYIWCYLGNFGGNTLLTGNMKESGERLERTLAEGGENVYGIGSTLEGFGPNIAIYEYILDKAWDNCKDDQEWIKTLADRHSGNGSETVRSAWAKIYKDVYKDASLSCMSNQVCWRPGRPGYSDDSRPILDVDPEILMDIWKDLVAEPSDRNAYLNDLANVGRDYLGRIFYDAKEELTAAYEAKDIQKFSELSEKLLDIIDDMDAITATRMESSLKVWVEKARQWGTTPEEKDYYEKNARTLITVWGGRKGLNDYANRAWGDLIRTFYKPRWEMYLGELAQSLRTGKKFVFDDFEKRSMAFEWSWIEPSYAIDYPEPQDPVELSRKLIEKYGK